MPNREDYSKEEVEALQRRLKRTQLRLRIAVGAGMAMGAWALFSIYLIGKVLERAL